jgi:putative hemolysin
MESSIICKLSTINRINPPATPINSVTHHVTLCPWNLLEVLPDFLPPDRLEDACAGDTVGGAGSREGYSDVSDLDLGELMVAFAQQGDCSQKNARTLVADHVRKAAWSAVTASMASQYCSTRGSGSAVRKSSIVAKCPRTTKTAALWLERNRTVHAVDDAC